MFDLTQLAELPRSITQDALARCDFPFDRLNRLIPVEWVDLSRYMHGGDPEMHDKLHKEGAHLIEDKARERVLGLAWYSGRVSVDISLVDEPALGMEVFLAEGAHMVDFFYMTPEHRQAIYKAFHGGSDAEHGHDWFDNPSYWDDVGEAFMGGFIKAYAPTVPVTLTAFTHPATDQVGKEIRKILTPELAPESSVFGKARSKVYHDKHSGISAEVTWPTAQAARADGRVPCRVCKPGG